MSADHEFSVTDALRLIRDVTESRRVGGTAGS